MDFSKIREKKMKILLSNDDGYDNMGILALCQEISMFGDVITVAPKVEQSAKGHSFTMGSPLRVKKVEKHRYYVDGTPADCVYLALNHLCPDVELVISGINNGANLGSDVYYSGTVAAAREAAIQGKKGIAVSLLTQKSGNDYQKAAKLAAKCIEFLLPLQWPFGLYWNINIPSTILNKDSFEVVVKPLGHRKYQSTVVQRKDPKGKPYYWIGGPPQPTEQSNTDAYWCEQGKIVLTPLHLQCTYKSIDLFKDLETTIML
jgi:5'-nucleotidase